MRYLGLGAKFERGLGPSLGLGPGLTLGRGLRIFLGVGATVGVIFGTSFGFTGSARRTSGSAGLAIGTGTGAGVVIAAAVGWVAGAAVVSGVVLGTLSTGNACGAMIVPGVAVATGVLPFAGALGGLTRWISRIAFMAMNPPTKTTIPIAKGRSDGRPPLCLRITTGRLGAGAGLSWR
jgi:hypothetical protein